MKFEINTVLLPVKLHYFFFFAGLACVMPIAPVYIHQLGISYRVIGDMYAVLPFSVIVAKPLFGALADRFRKHKAIFLTSIALTALVYFAIDFIPDQISTVDLSANRILCTEDEQVLVELCSSNQTQTCVPEDVETFKVLCSLSCTPANSSSRQQCGSDSDVDCVEFHNVSDVSPIEEEPIFVGNDETFTINSTLTCGTHSITNSTGVANITDEICNMSTSLQCVASCTCAVIDDTYRYDSSFVVLFVLLLLSYLFAGVVISIGDALAMDCVIATKADFGCQRVLGTIGWGLFAVISGLIFQSVSSGSRTNYSPGFYMLLVLLLLNCFVAYFVKVYHNPRPKKMLSHLLRIYSDPRLVVFSLSVFVMGFLTSALWTFLVLYLTGMGAPPSLIGYAMGVQCFGGEMPLFLLSGFILKKVGHVYSMSICLMAYALRFVLYSVVTDPWWVLPIELTNGLTFGLFFATMVTFGGIVAPEGMSATTQGALQSIYEGFGVGIGNLVCGRLYQSYGGRQMYRILGVSSCICCVVYTIAMALILKFGRYSFKSSAKQAYAEKAADVKHDEKVEMNSPVDDSS